MKSLIVFDSVFGNTKNIAEAMGRAIDAPVISVADCSRTLMEDVELLIVGSPTRAFRPTKPMARLLSGFSLGSLAGIRVAAFDTRADLQEVNSKFLAVMVKVFGYAAPYMDKSLRRAGANIVAAPEGFFVHGSEGPLRDGETERASAWALSLLGK